jgi:hypothetical protein
LTVSPSKAFSIRRSTVEAVFSRISELADQYDEQPFFRLLESAAGPAQVEALVPALAFFVFAFQDMLRLNEEQMVDPALKAIARKHRAEDAGHQNWFLHDARCLGVEPDVEWTFGQQQRPTRDTSYQLISEVFRASDDRVRVVIPMVLEAAGHPFFRRVFRFFENAGVQAELKYFALSHWQVEEGHEMLQDAQSAYLRELQLPAELRAECLQMVERMFAAMATMVSDLNARMRAPKPEHRGRRKAPLHVDAALE